MEYRAGIFCGEVEVVLSNRNYGIEFLKLFEHDGIHEIRFTNIPIVEGLRSVVLNKYLKTQFHIFLYCDFSLLS
ncbi:hypothetical protein QFZ73_005584 [Peribacillus sp. V2I11]|nr:hypothetical protein [Peribacillus sp. V2I11]